MTDRFKVCSPVQPETSRADKLLVEAYSSRRLPPRPVTDVRQLLLALRNSRPVQSETSRVVRAFS